MIGSLGHTALLALVLTSGGGVLVHLRAIFTKQGQWRTNSRLVMIIQFACAAIASICLIDLLIRENNHYAYVAEYTGPGLALIYRIAAFWGGNQGSLLFWCLVLTMYGGAVAFFKHEDSESWTPWVNFFMGCISLFFAIVTTFAANPFARLAHSAAVGSGLSPLLQNPGMTVHPVNVYLGYIGFSVPFAYAMTALVLKRTDATWLRITRRWTLVSWLFLSIGIVYGAHWSYEELGWGGYWAWDPVENASLLPWLTGTALLHSSIVQERRGMLKGWNVILVSLTFVLTLLGTFLTRSGVLWSIHAFADSSLGRYFMVFLILATISSATLIGWRWRVLRPDRRIESVVSKETGFLLNNVLFLSCTFAVLWGTIFPIVSQALTGNTMMVSAPFYNAVNLPLGVCILFLMGVGPLVAWRRSSLKSVLYTILSPLIIALVVGIATSDILRIVYHRYSLLASCALVAALYGLITVFMEFYGGVRSRVAMTNESILMSSVRLVSRNRRRYGGYVVHLAVALMAIGIAGSGAFHVDLQESLTPGQTSTVFAGYRATFEGIEVTGTADQRRMKALLLITRGNRTLGMLTPGATFFANGQQPNSDVALFSRPLRDLYVVMLGTSKDKSAVFDFHVNPLVQWIWYGGYLFILGTVVSLWPESKRRFMVLRSSQTPQPLAQSLVELEYDFRMGKITEAEYHDSKHEILGPSGSRQERERRIRARLEEEVASLNRTTPLDPSHKGISP